MKLTLKRTVIVTLAFPLIVLAVGLVAVVDAIEGVGEVWRSIQ